MNEDRERRLRKWRARKNGETEVKAQEANIHAENNKKELEKKTVTELREMAKAESLPGYSQMTKGELVAALGKS